MTWTVNSKPGRQKKRKCTKQELGDAENKSSSVPKVSSNAAKRRKVRDKATSSAPELQKVPGKPSEGESPMTSGKDPDAGDRQTPDSDVTCFQSRSELGAMLAMKAMISDKDGDRLIHVAVAQENLELVEHLCNVMLKSDISLDVTNHLRQTPLHVAVIVGNLNMITLLFNYGSSLVLRDRKGNSVLHLAIKSGANQEVLSLLLSHPDAKDIIDSLDYEGYSPLHHAVFKLNKEAVLCLHFEGAQMDIVDGKSGRSPLLHAILSEDEGMVKVLLDCGASSDSMDFSRRSALDIALQTSSKPVLKLLQQDLPSAAGSKETLQNKRTRTVRCKNP